MAPGFSVYLNNLGQMAKSIDGAADAFTAIEQTANGPGRIAQNALGFFGSATNFPAKYRAMCDNVARGAKQSADAFSKAADEFIALEKRYAARDDYWAKQFGVKADHIKPKIPDLDGPPQAPNPNVPSPGGPTQPHLAPLPPANPKPFKLPTQTI